jgi:uncharacterized protein YifE (UPF0438 family)
MFPPCQQRSSAILVAALSVLAFISRSAHASGPLGPDGAPITTSDFAIDVFGGPVLGGTRMTGLGGAYSAIAEGVDGNQLNPATPAVRPFYSVSPVDYWFGFGFTLPALSELDYFNTGERDPEARLPSKFVYVTPAANLQWRTVGIGLSLELQQYALPAPTEGGKIITRLATSHFQLANGFFDGDLVIGLGARNVSLSVSDESCEGKAFFECLKTEVRRRKYAFASSGLGPEFGILLKPAGLPFRAGAAFRSQVDTRPRLGGADYASASGDVIIQANGEAFYVPRSVSVPWDLNLGFAYQFGRPFNARWRMPQDIAAPVLAELEREKRALEAARDRELVGVSGAREREAVEARFFSLLARNERQREYELERAYLVIQQEFADWKRFYVLLTGSLLISGSVPAAVGIEAFFEQTVVRSGNEPSYSPHFGLESEAVPDVLKLRTGGYIEPPRSTGSSARGHVTIGGDLRLTGFDVFGFWPSDYVWAISAFADMAPRYATFGFAIGGWYPRWSGRVPLPERPE